MKRGLYNLLSSFYESIKNNLPPPIPYNQILMSSRIIGEIIKQVFPAASGILPKGTK
ncbi:MAG: hypothetical protein N3B16_12200 [Candidatus Aminicenantes bacterium]|nr:hypothetical protein [Candidatus Aminicenantes bacterium]